MFMPVWDCVYVYIARRMNVPSHVWIIYSIYKCMHISYTNTHNTIHTLQEREEAEMNRRREELNRLKNQKKQEIYERLKKIQELSKAKDVGADMVSSLPLRLVVIYVPYCQSTMLLSFCFPSNRKSTY